MSFIDAGIKKSVAAADTSGLNTGNWTNTLTHDLIGVTVPRFELYKIVLINVPQIASPTLYKGGHVFSATVLVGNAEWDPSQPMPLTPDDDIYLAWNIAATGTAPVGYFWFRYDPAINPAQI